jgi:hypothetical protein
MCVIMWSILNHSKLPQEDLHHICY